jgi:hypothetical protein
MRALLAIVFWTLAAVEGAVLLFMLFVSLAAGPGMAENRDLATPLFWNVLLPLAGLTGAIVLFTRSRAPAWRGLALLIVVAPVLWLVSWTEGETIYTNFANSTATGDGLP